jgi:hypothetical protein
MTNGSEFWACSISSLETGVSSFLTIREALTRIKEELSTRNLSELPSEKLLDLFIKFGNLMKQEEIPVVFTGTEGLPPVDSWFEKEVRWDG